MEINTKDTTALFRRYSVNRAPLRRSGLLLRSLTAVSLVAVGAVIFALSALADRPTKTTFEGVTVSTVLTDVCAFPINVDATVSGTETDYFDQSGTLTRSFFHQVEQDTFTANGRTLVGTPFTFNFDALFDSDGNVTQAFTDGVVETIPLPDGTLFISAGRTDWTQRLGGFVLSPDMGNSGNLAAFCAALSP
jgi:hypothetical protein